MKASSSALLLGSEIPQRIKRHQLNSQQFDEEVAPFEGVQAACSSPLSVARATKDSESHNVLDSHFNDPLESVTTLEHEESPCAPLFMASDSDLSSSGFHFFTTNDQYSRATKKLKYTDEQNVSYGSGTEEIAVTPPSDQDTSYSPQLGKRKKPEPIVSLEEYPSGQSFYFELLPHFDGDSRFQESYNHMQYLEEDFYLNNKEDSTPLEDVGFEQLYFDTAGMAECVNFGDVFTEDGNHSFVN